MQGVPPQRYTAVFKDDDVLAINDGFAVWYLVSKGRCPNSNAYQLAIEETRLLFRRSTSRFCVYVPFVKGKTFIEESRRIARQNGSGDIFTVALNE